MNLKSIENIKNPVDDLQTNYLSLHEETIKSLSLWAFFVIKLSNIIKNEKEEKDIEFYQMRINNKIFGAIKAVKDTK